jgi:hypothetical protein
LHKSINNIGSAYNNELQDIPGSFYVEREGLPRWIGNSYLLWSGTTPKIPVTTWLYNESDGLIIFEVTALYPYHFSETDEEVLISYQEWVKTQSPSQTVYKTILSPEVAQRWLKQLEDVLKIIEFNSLPPDHQFPNQS